MLRETFTAAMRNVASTVSVVSTDGPAGRAGVTVSSMTSVSADAPQPTLLICVHHKCSAAPAIIGNRAFCVNVLREDQARISDYFAGRIRPPDGDRFGCADWTTQATGAPRILDPLVAFDCRLLNSALVGTHHVFIGAVEEIFVGTPGAPLVYADRSYRATRPLA